jgi:hypothetical protein
MGVQDGSGKSSLPPWSSIRSGECMVPQGSYERGDGNQRYTEMRGRRMRERFEFSSLLLHDSDLLLETTNLTLTLTRLWATTLSAHYTDGSGPWPLPTPLFPCPAQVLTES